MSTTITLRPETERDYRAVEHLTRDAFWDIYKPGCDEHLLAHKLRSVEAFLPELDYVAVQDGRIVGNIMYSAARVIDDGGRIHPILTFGPLSVLPDCQGQGIGSVLVRHTLDIARATGYPAVIIFGNPGFYHRFGFKSADQFGITTREGASLDAFMALPLYEGALNGISGRFYEDDVFQVDPMALDEFDKAFPYREKHITDTQLK